MISTIMMPLGMLVFGPVADTVRIEYLLWGTGVGLSAIAVMMIACGSLVQAGRHPGGTT
jgi:MFS transporter, DHA3 family, macrolide efflux protein